MAYTFECKLAKQIGGVLVDAQPLVSGVTMVNVGSSAKDSETVKTRFRFVLKDNRATIASLNALFYDAAQYYRASDSMRLFLQMRLQSDEQWWGTRVVEGIAMVVEDQFQKGITNETSFLEVTITHEGFWQRDAGIAKLYNVFTPVSGTAGWVQVNNSNAVAGQGVVAVNTSDYSPSYNAGDIGAVPTLMFKNAFSTQPKRVIVGMARGTSSFNPYAGVVSSNTWSGTAPHAMSTTLNVSGGVLSQLANRAIQPIVTLPAADTYGGDLRVQWYFLVTGYSTVIGYGGEIGFESGHQLQRLAPAEIVQGDWTNTSLPVSVRPTSLANVTMGFIATRLSGASTTLEFKAVHLLPLDGWRVYEAPSDNVLANDFVFHNDLTDQNGIVISGSTSVVPGVVDYYGPGFELMPNERYTFCVMHENQAGAATGGGPSYTPSAISVQIALGLRRRNL